MFWVSGELSMGVRSSVTRAEKILNERMKHDKILKKQWNRIEMQQISLPRMFDFEPFGAVLDWLPTLLVGEAK